jgi:hypothetical protein
MLSHYLHNRPSALAVMVGALVLIVCSLTRAAGQPLVDHLPIVALVSTLLVFLIPGAVTGAIAPRSFFWNGAILGLIAAAFVTIQSNQFRALDWSSFILYETVGVLACLSVPACLVGALGGRYVSRRR